MEKERERGGYLHFNAEFQDIITVLLKHTTLADGLTDGGPSNINRFDHNGYIKVCHN